MDTATKWFIAGFVVLVVVVVVVAGITSGGFGTNNSSTQPGFVATTASPITSSDWVEGNTAAKVSLIEYGDYQCPACGEYEPLVEQLVNEYGSKIEFVFRNFPLYSIHPNAGAAAEAAEAAGLQGKFWQMHDLLYAKQSDWADAPAGSVVKQYFNGYASSLGLNVTQFDSDMASSKVADKISADVDSGNAASIDHTPTFFINLKQIPNPANGTEFQSDIESALAAAGVSTSTTGAVNTGTINTTSTSGTSSAAPMIPVTVTVTSTPASGSANK